MASEVSVQMNKILREYQDEVDKLANEEFKEVADDTAKDLQNTSPSKTGDYAKGWTVKAQKGVGKMNYVVYNRTDYQLTHLLENGHIIVNAYGVQQRKNGGGNMTDSHKHIAPAAEKAEQELIERLESKL